MYDKINHVVKRADLGDDWYCFYTDNKDIHKHFKHNFSVITVHGCPGDHKEWARLEKYIKPNYVRWINYIIPGFD